MDDGSKLKISVVICTYNRDEYLERTLNNLNNINYDDFEVIVVNGPSIDRTSEILQEYITRIKIVSNSKANLSVSRNMGIRASSGDVVAFIDDDAIPEANWLDQISEVYKEGETVGGVGGRVYGPGGDHFQFHNGIINVWGEADVKRELPGEYIQPINTYYNILMGVNSTFSRKYLIEIGGFDEYYEYYHDESDVCVRLIKAGFPVLHHQEAFVHHEFAKSHIRETNYKLNWYPIVKNTVYFGIKNSKTSQNLLSRIYMPLVVAFKRLDEFKNWFKNGYISREDYKSFKKMWFKGLRQGMLDGFYSQRKTSNNLDDQSEFLQFIKYNTNKTSNIQANVPSIMSDQSDQKLGICLISKYYPPYGNGGVATYTRQLAEGLVNKGHNVFVVTSGMPEMEMELNGVRLIDVASVSNTSLEDGNSIFDFIPTDYSVTKNNLIHSLKVSLIVENLFNKGLITIMESPLWDYEGLIASNIDGLKSFVRLETPLKVAAETQNWKWNNDFELSSRLEKYFIEKCSAVIAISEDIKDRIEYLYDINWGLLQVTSIPLGINGEDLNEIGANSLRRQVDNKINILFLGRLERRKGIDILLRAALNICEKHSNVQFTIAGNNDIEFENGKTIVEKLKVDLQRFENQILFTGEVSDEEKIRLLKNSDIFVAPSRYESFGLVFLEAMQYFNAIIGTNVGGVKEIIDNNKNGILVEKENIKELERALLTCINDSELREKFATSARLKYDKKFTVDRMVEKTLDYYLSSNR